MTTATSVAAAYAVSAGDIFYVLSLLLILILLLDNRQERYVEARRQESTGDRGRPPVSLSWTGLPGAFPGVRPSRVRGRPPILPVPLRHVPLDFTARVAR